MSVDRRGRTYGMYRTLQLFERSFARADKRKTEKKVCVQLPFFVRFKDNSEFVLSRGTGIGSYFNPILSFGVFRKHRGSPSSPEWPRLPTTFIAPARTIEPGHVSRVVV